MIVSTKELCKFYGPVKALDRTTLDIAEGELCVLLGPSGCGKTTLLRLIAGLEMATSGSLMIDGVEAHGTPAYKRPIGFVFQSYALFPHLSVFKNIAYGLEVQKLPPSEIKKSVRETAALLGIDHLLERSVHQLSGGQQQRVALVRALVTRPKILLFDEPLSNLDTRLRRSVREEIRSIHDRFKMTSVYVTHDQGEALSLADRIVLMKDGRIVESGEPSELYEKPEEPFTANFLGETNLVPVTVERTTDQCRVHFGSESLQVPFFEGIHETSQLLVRPEAVRLSRTEGFRGKIQKTSYLGWCREYTVQCSFGPLFAIDTEMHEDFRVGDEVSVRFSRHRLLHR